MSSSLLGRLLNRERSSLQSAIGISLTPQNAAWCQVVATGDAFNCLGGHSVSGDFKSPADALQALVSESPLPNVSSYITLGPPFYNLLLVDAPAVPDDEMREAVRWKVKDLIADPVEEVVLDTFRLPDDAYRGRMNMVYVASMHTRQVAALVSQCEALGMRLGGIGVTELAMAALTTRVSAFSGRGVAVLFLNGASGTINLVENGCLYLTRNIELGQVGGNYSGHLDFQQDPIDNLALDVQRSLDYYESQIGKSGVSDLFLVSLEEDLSDWLDPLQERLPVRVQLCRLSAMVSHDELALLDTGKLSAAFGAALGGLHAAI